MSCVFRYRYVLDAPTSVVQKRGEDSLTYLNKGQFYSILLEGHLDDGEVMDRVRSVVHLGFRDEHDPAAELQRWQYWHSQQPNPNQKAFDVGKMNCSISFLFVGSGRVSVIWRQTHFVNCRP
jgi:transcription factor CP2-like protein